MQLARIGVALLAIGVASPLNGQPAGPQPISSQTPKQAKALTPPLSLERVTQGSEARFVARSRGSRLTLHRRGAVLDAARRAVWIEFAGASREPDIYGEDELRGRVYHAIGDFTGPMIANATFGRVRYRQLYPGIDAVFYGTEGELEFDFQVSPRARPGQIRLTLHGADSIALEPSGDLSLRLGGEQIRLKKPAVYQERDGIRIDVAGRYRLFHQGSEVGFDLGPYDHSFPLIIDPTIQFATYFGGAGNEFIAQVKANASGDSYLFGRSNQSPSLPEHHTYTILAQPVAQECFLTKLRADGSGPEYTVVFGGADCRAVDVSNDGKVHLSVGGSGPTFLGTLNESNMTLGPLQGSYSVDSATHPSFAVLWIRVDSIGNVYFIVVSAPGSSLVYELQKVSPQGVLLGRLQLLTTPLVNGAFPDSVQALDVDDAGHAYVLGIVRTAGVITPTPNAFQPVKPVKQSAFVRSGSGFLQRVDTSIPNAFLIDYATFVGGTKSDAPAAVAFDPVSNGVFVAGSTNSSDFPTTRPDLAPTFGQNRAFLLKFDLSQSAAQQLVSGTFLSPSSSAFSLTLLPGGLPVIGGNADDNAADDTPFPVVNSLYPPLFTYVNRPYLTIFSADIGTLLFSTFLDPGSPSNGLYPLLTTKGSNGWSSR